MCRSGKRLSGSNATQNACHMSPPMTENAAEDRGAVWSRYWATGTPHSCATSYRDTYDGSIGAFWRDAFAKLGADDRVLDLACGNAALARLLLQVRPAEPILCDAVDLAVIRPAWLEDVELTLQSRIRVHDGVDVESLPFADRSFSMVVSQYGIEYTNLSRSIPEILRVLSPGGRIRIVAHHANSLPVQLAATEINHIDWLNTDKGLLDLTAAMVPLIARAATAAGRAILSNSFESNDVRTRFNRVQTEASELIAASACPDVLHDVREDIKRIFIIANTCGADEGLQALSTLRIRLADSRFRLDELCRHALDETSAKSLCEDLSRGGARLSLALLIDAGHLFGWSICGDPHAKPPVE